MYGGSNGRSSMKSTFIARPPEGEDGDDEKATTNFQRPQAHL